MCTATRKVLWLLLTARPLVSLSPGHYSVVTGFSGEVPQTWADSTPAGPSVSLDRIHTLYRAAASPS